MFDLAVRVFDRWTCNQTCFNAARSRKPLNNGITALNGHQSEDLNMADCDFCAVEIYTGEGEQHWLFHFVPIYHPGQLKILADKPNGPIFSLATSIPWNI